MQYVVYEWPDGSVITRESIPLTGSNWSGWDRFTFRLIRPRGSERFADDEDAFMSADRVTILGDRHGTCLTWRPEDVTLDNRRYWKEFFEATLDMEPRSYVTGGARPWSEAIGQWGDWNAIPDVEQPGYMPEGLELFQLLSETPPFWWETRMFEEWIEDSGHILPTLP